MMLIMYTAWRRLYERQYSSDAALLITNPYFIVKKLLRDVVKGQVDDWGGGVLLDIGCGDKPLRCLFPKFRNYVGIDLSIECKPDLVSSAYRIPVRDTIADAILCTEVLEHTREPQKVVAELFRLLKPGGKLLVSVPMSWNLHYEPTDFYRFTSYGLTYTLEKAGFNVIKVQRVAGLTSLIGARIADVIQSKVQNLPIVRDLQGRGRGALAGLVVVPINLVFFLLGRLLDPVDRTDAFGWVAVAQKPWS